MKNEETKSPADSQSVPKKPSTSTIWNQWEENLIEWRKYLKERFRVRRSRPKWHPRIALEKWIARQRTATAMLSYSLNFHRDKQSKKAPTAEHHNSPVHHQFQESEYRIIQFALFIGGSLPRLVENKQGRRNIRRQRQIRIANRLRSWTEDVRLHPVAFLGGAFAIAIIAAVLSIYTIGVSATYNGYDLGTVGGLITVPACVSRLESITRETLGDETYKADTSALETHMCVAKRRNLVDRQTFTTNLSRQLNRVTYAHVLYVDEQPIAATTYADALEGLLEQLKAGYSSPNTVESYFTESVEVREEYVSNEYVMNLGYIAELLNETKSGEITYTVEAGDAPLSIADDCGISYDDLKAMNPGYNWSVLNVGDVLTISNAVPYLTVVNVERQNYLESIPYSIEYTEDSTMYQGDYKVLSAGSFGKADVTANVTLVNGEEIQRSVVSSVTLLAPTTEQQATGTMERPSWFPTGSFRWPCSGYISSYFGYRNTGIRGASTYHQAIDIANSYGTPIYAADGGTVITAGWISGLGYTVKIDHGNGYVTTYGHNSSLTVSVGEHVYKGQQIARMGSTGVSSGNHCDFRICLNGTYVNPLNYLS